MGERVNATTGAEAALDAQAGHRRERQERDRRIEALAVKVPVALGERGRRSGAAKHDQIPDVADRANPGPTARRSASRVGPAGR